MGIEEGKALVDRAMKVILSCKTEDQLVSASKYTNLVCKKVFPPLNVIERLKVVSTIEFTKGVAFGRLKCGVDV